MRFDSEAYDKLYPRDADNGIKIESAVDTFTPTADEMHDGTAEGEDVDGTDNATAGE